MICFVLGCLALLGLLLGSVYLDGINVGKWYLSFYWDTYKYLMVFDWMDKEDRYWGYNYLWYDGPHHHFGFWFFQIGWCFD